MQPEELIQTIPTPKPSLKKLSFCDSNKPQRVIEWASLLRPTQIEVTSSMLYKALPELNQLITSSQARFQMLEALRPYVQNAIAGLSKSFLHKPISLPPDAQKSAVIAQALQKHMVDGYILVVKAAVESKKNKSTADTMFSTSLHRAMTGIGLLFMRSYQIYTQPTKGLWQILHGLFQISDHFELLDSRVKDETQRLAKISSVESAYLRISLLASARPHQLGQNDISIIYHTFGEWAEQLRFSVDLSSDPDCFFYLNLERDCGPLYKSRVTDEERQQLLVELNYKTLLNQIAKQSRESIEETGSSTIKVSREISASLLSHVLETWGNVAQRKQERRQAQMTADICVGLTDCHYYVCNGQNFDTFIRNASSPQDIENTATGGFTPRDAFATTQEFDRPVNRVEVNNISQSGYCLLWKSSTPMRVESGDLVTIREFGKRVWTIGVVRWIRQKKNASQLGVQILSDKAQPFGIAQTYDMGGYSDYMRALYLPQSQFSEDPPTLITSSAPFQPHDRVKILDGDKTITAKLDERLFSTGPIQQFSFHIIETSETTTAKKSTGRNWG